MQTGLKRTSRFFTRNLAATSAAAVILAAVLAAPVSMSRAAGSDADLSKLQPGMPLPELRIEQELTPAHRRYLGLGGRLRALFSPEGFSASSVDADVVVIEFYNVYCTSCQKQAPIMNEVFKRVNARDDMRGRIKFFGIGAGNNEDEAAMFMRRYSVGFPLFADPGFVNYDAVGEPGATPLTVIAKKHGSGLVVVSAHAGFIENPDFFMGALRSALNASPETLSVQRADRYSAKLEKRPRIDLNMSAEQVERKVLACMRRAAGGDDSIKSVRRLSLPRSGDVYVAMPEGSADGLYAQVVSRPPTCDVCHGVHFILVFDAAGTVRDFEPLHLTKYGNVVWSSHDADFMRRHLIGLNVRQPFEFNPEVDSVTTATMTSTIIYNSAQRLRDVLREISEQ